MVAQGQALAECGLPKTRSLRRSEFVIAVTISLSLCPPVAKGDSVPVKFMSVADLRRLKIGECSDHIAPGPRQSFGKQHAVARGFCGSAGRMWPHDKGRISKEATQSKR